MKLNDPLRFFNYTLYKDNSIIKRQLFRNVPDLNINVTYYQIPKGNIKLKD